MTNTETETSEQPWHKTACILCESNCGIEVRLDGTRFTRIRGNKDHVGSKGYTCEKALRLDRYQNHRARLTTPMRRRPDGTYEPIDWDTAIADVAARLAAIRDAYGGESIFTYGGGGQGNHLGGVYGQALAAGLGVRYRSNAIAQEKTGEAFVEARLYRAHTRADIEHTEVAVFLGKNPWNSHGFAEARRTLQELARDPLRSIVVIDPKRTKTAEMADFHLQLRPGTDAFCIAALLGVLVRDDLLDHEYLASHVDDLEPVLAAIRRVPIDDFAARCDLPLELIESVAHRIGRAASVAIFEDLGIEQAPNSTLVSYLHRLVTILRGSLATKGGTNPHSAFNPVLVGNSGTQTGRSKQSPVTGAPIISGLVPCNSIADEILTDHPDRFRAMIIESSNPAHSLADSPRFREAMEALEFSLVIDVTMTETARLADYILPAATQYEKPEAVFFNFEFPDNVFYLRKPLLDPAAGTLPEPEIHARIAEALGLYLEADLVPVREAAIRGRAEFLEAFGALMAERPDLVRVGALVLYRTLGPTLPDGLAGAAALWYPAQVCAATYPIQVTRAGIDARDGNLGDALFEAVLASDDGVVFTRHLQTEAWDLIQSDDQRIRPNIAQLLDKLDALVDAPTTYTSDEFPFVLSAGERRSFTANTIFRDPDWRKTDAEGTLAINPDDALGLGVANGDRLRLTTATGSAEPTARVDDSMRPGHLSLPNGMGLDYPDENGHYRRAGIAPNDLTALEWKDDIAGTPWHKHVPARIESLTAAEKRL